MKLTLTEARKKLPELVRRVKQDSDLRIYATTLLDNLPCLAFDRDFRALGLTVFS